FCVMVFSILRLSAWIQLSLVLGGLGWGYFLFGYMHKSMHLERFWMERVPVLRGWYRGIRRLHDIHHLDISNDGRMMKNFGICSFVMDRIFRSYCPKLAGFNQAGFQAANRRYAFVFTDPKS